MVTRQWLRVLAAGAVLALVLAACGDDSGSTASDTTGGTQAGGGGPLVYGALLPESGSLAAIIDSLRTPIDMAVTEINAAGGVLGADVEVKAADDGTDDSTVASAGFDRLVNSDGINVLLGPASSTLTENLMSDIANNDIVACSGSNTAASLADLEDNGHYFGFAPNDNLQGPALAELVTADGYQKVAVLARNDTYGTGFSAAVTQALKDSGADVVLDQTYDPNATSFKAEAEAVASSGAQAAIVIGFNDDGAKVVSAMIEAGVGPKDLPLYTADGMKGSSFWESVNPDDPSAVQGIKGTAPAAAPAGVEHPFQAAFAETGVDTIFSAYFYDCTIVTALATEAAGSTEADAIAAAIPEVTSGGTQCQTFAECKDLLDQGEDVDYEGASGSLNLDDGGHVTSGAYDVWQFDAEGKDVTLDEPQIVVGG